MLNQNPAYRDYPGSSMYLIVSIPEVCRLSYLGYLQIGVYNHKHIGTYSKLGVCQMKSYTKLIHCRCELKVPWIA